MEYTTGEANASPVFLFSDGHRATRIHISFNNAALHHTTRIYIATNISAGNI